MRNAKIFLVLIGLFLAFHVNAQLGTVSNPIQIEILPSEAEKNSQQEAELRPKYGTFYDGCKRNSPWCNGTEKAKSTTIRNWDQECRTSILLCLTDVVKTVEYKNYSCQKQYGTTAVFDKVDTAGVNRCKCGAGYTFNSSNQCVTYEQFCSSLTGSLNYTIETNGQFSCGCRAGYKAGTNNICMPDSVACKESEELIGDKCTLISESCRRNFGEGSEWRGYNGVENRDGIGNCRCKSGYAVNKSKLKCENVKSAKYATPSIALVVRSGKSTKSTKISSLKKSTKYQITDLSDKVWVKVRVGSKEGYVMRKFVAIK